MLTFQGSGSATTVLLHGQGVKQRQQVGGGAALYLFKSESSTLQPPAPRTGGLSNHCCPDNFMIIRDSK